MTYQDAWAICTHCGGRFIFRIEEQRRQAKRGEQITPPERCPSCQAQLGAERIERRREPASRPAPAEVGSGPREGSVKWYDPEKGYGFIVHPGGEEIFFHRTGIAPGEIPEFADGVRVIYCVEQTEKGLQAVDVQRLERGG